MFKVTETGLTTFDAAMYRPLKPVSACVVAKRNSACQHILYMYVISHIFSIVGTCSHIATNEKLNCISVFGLSLSSCTSCIVWEVGMVGRPHTMPAHAQFKLKAQVKAH